MAAVAYGSVLRFEMLDLQNLALERRDRCKLHSRQCADAVNPYAEAHHIVLVLWKSLYTGGVQNVPHRLITQSLRQ